MSKTASRSIRIHHWFLCRWIGGRHLKIARYYRRLDRTKNQLERAQQQIRALEKENMWLHTGSAGTHE